MAGPTPPWRRALAAFTVTESSASARRRRLPCGFRDMRDVSTSERCEATLQQPHEWPFGIQGPTRSHCSLDRYSFFTCPTDGRSTGRIPDPTRKGHYQPRARGIRSARGERREPPRLLRTRCADPSQTARARLPEAPPERAPRDRGRVHSGRRFHRQSGIGRGVDEALAVREESGERGTSPKGCGQMDGVMAAYGRRLHRLRQDPHTGVDVHHVDQVEDRVEPDDDSGGAASRRSGRFDLGQDGG